MKINFVRDSTTTKIEKRTFEYHWYDKISIKIPTRKKEPTKPCKDKTRKILALASILTEYCEKYIALVEVTQS